MDNKCRMWFGTGNGLYCFDGYSIIEITEKHPIVKLTDFRITCLSFNNKNNCLVVGTENGLNILNVTSFRNTGIGKRDPNRARGSSRVNCCLVDSGGMAWAAIGASKILLLTDTIVKKEFNLADDIKAHTSLRGDGSPTIAGLSSDKQHLHFSTMYNSVFAIDKATFSTTFITTVERGLISVIPDKGALTIFDYFGATRLAENNYKDQKQLPVQMITYASKDQLGGIWYVKDKNSIYKIGNDFVPEPIYTLTDEQISKYKQINNLYVSKDRIWVGTANGIFSLHRANRAFTRIFLSEKEYSENELSSRGIIQQNDSTLFLAGYNFLFKYNPVSKQLDKLIPKDKAKKIVPYALLAKSDSLFIACEGNGLRLLKISEKKIIPIAYSNNINLASRFGEEGLIRAITKVGDELLLAEYGMIGKYNLRNRELSGDLKSHYIDGKRADNVVQILPLHNGNLLFVRNNTLYITTKNLKMVDKIIPEEYSGLKKNTGVSNVYEDKSGNLWIASLGEGILFYNGKQKTIRRYTTKDGLSDDVVYSLLQSNDGKVWAATNNGLSVYDTTKHVFNSYFETDGLCNNEFNTNSYLKAANGDLYFGGMKGVTRIDPTILNEDKEPEPFFISRVTVPGSGANIDSSIVSGLDRFSSIHLPFQSRFLDVFFSITNYSRQNKFAYRLIGLDSNWTSLGAENHIRFNVLPPGSYTLNIKAWNNHSVPVSKILSVQITADQVFYKTIWFSIIFCVILVMIAGSIFYILYRSKLRSIKQIAAMRLNIASELHDQVGGLLNKTAIIADKIKASEDPHQRDELNKIADNSRVALSGMKDILWNLDSRNDNSISLVDRMNEYAHKMLEDDFVYHINVNSLERVELSHEIRQTINLIFKEAINNIVKHAPASNVKVNVAIEDRYINLHIFSSGNYKEKSVHSGQGLKNMRMRTEKAGGKFSLIVDDGVEIKVNLPVK